MGKPEGRGNKWVVPVLVRVKKSGEGWSLIEKYIGGPE
jgi:hypothetical protein